jgi:hypothetical protein
MNLYNATREDDGLDSIKLGDNMYDDDSDEQLSASYPFGDEYGSESGGWTGNFSRDITIREVVTSYLIVNSLILASRSYA